MIRKILFVCFLIAVMILAGCGGSTTTETKKEELKQPTAAPAVAPEPGGAAIEGKVAFVGAKPARTPVSMDATPQCSRQHSSPPLSEVAIVNDNGTLKNVFVYVKAGLPNQTWPAPKGPVTIDQSGCMYKPHVTGVMVGQNVEFLNNDPTNHNVHPLPMVNREWNQSQAPKGDPIIRTFDKEEIMVPIKCNLHPWMRVYVGVVSHPFFAVSGDDGAFAIKGLPAGEYTLEAWHERFPKQELKVKVDAAGVAKAEFTFKG